MSSPVATLARRAVAAALCAFALASHAADPGRFDQTVNKTPGNKG